MDITAETKHPVAEDTAFVQFWNEVLAPKFIQFKHVLVDGLTQHSEAVLPTLRVRQGDRVLASAAASATPRSSSPSWSGRRARWSGSTAVTPF
jgi:hypothetical protein